MKDDDFWKRDEVDSPCNKICVIHPQAKICAGCFRTMEEIAAWPRLTSEERKALVADLPDRAGLLRKRRGGRSARQTS